LASAAVAADLPLDLVTPLARAFYDVVYVRYVKVNCRRHVLDVVATPNISAPTTHAWLGVLQHAPHQSYRHRLRR
jgi:hypothetical protein